jgi:phosphohistidine phosphatase
MSMAPSRHPRYVLMELYLLQHGEATSKEVDARRPLTDRGREDVTRVGRTARAAGIRVAAIYHSGKLRAEQTAQILSEELGVKGAPTVLGGSHPMTTRTLLL